jgi:hypothetical protein
MVIFNFFQLCDFAPPISNGNIRLPLVVTPSGADHLKKMKETVKRVKITNF